MNRRVENSFDDSCELTPRASNLRRRIISSPIQRGIECQEERPSPFEKLIETIKFFPLGQPSNKHPHNGIRANEFSPCSDNKECRNLTTKPKKRRGASKPRRRRPHNRTENCNKEPHSINIHIGEIDQDPKLPHTDLNDKEILKRGSRSADSYAVDQQPQATNVDANLEQNKRQLTTFSGDRGDGMCQALLITDDAMVTRRQTRRSRSDSKVKVKVKSAIKNTVARSTTSFFDSFYEVEGWLDGTSTPSHKYLQPSKTMSDPRSSRGNTHQVCEDVDILNEDPPTNDQGSDDVYTKVTGKECCHSQPIIEMFAKKELLMQQRRRTNKSAEKTLQRYLHTSQPIQVEETGKKSSRWATTADYHFIRDVSSKLRGIDGNTVIVSEKRRSRPTKSGQTLTHVKVSSKNNTAMTRRSKSLDTREIAERTGIINFPGSLVLHAATNTNADSSLNDDNTKQYNVVSVCKNKWTNDTLCNTNVLSKRSPQSVLDPTLDNTCLTKKQNKSVSLIDQYGSAAPLYPPFMTLTPRRSRSSPNDSLALSHLEMTCSLASSLARRCTESTLRDPVCDTKPSKSPRGDKLPRRGDAIQVNYLSPTTQSPARISVAWECVPTTFPKHRSRSVDSLNIPMLPPLNLRSITSSSGHGFIDDKQDHGTRTASLQKMVEDIAALKKKFKETKRRQSNK